MPFQKGKSGNPGGRPKGGDISTEIRKGFILAARRLDDDGTPLSTLIYDSLRKDFLNTLKALAPYAPKNIDLGTEDGQPLTINLIAHAPDNAAIQLEPPEVSTPALAGPRNGH